MTLFITGLATGLALGAFAWALERRRSKRALEDLDSYWMEIA